jgi:hypothetical protein
MPPVLFTDTCEQADISVPEWIDSLDGTPLGLFLCNNWNQRSVTPIIAEYLRRRLNEFDSPVVIGGFIHSPSDVAAIVDIVRGRPVAVMGDYGKEVRKMLDMHGFSAEYSRHPIPAGVPRGNVGGGTFVEVDVMMSAEIFQRASLMVHNTRTTQQFFGTLSTSLLHEHLPAFQKHPYVASFALNGRQFIAYRFEGYWYLLSADLKVYACGEYPGHDVILDVTLVDDCHFVITDVLMYGDTNVMKQSLQKRMQYAESISMPLSTTLHTYYPASELGVLLQSVTHLPLTGVVFTPASLPYRLGRDFNMYVWKPLTHNTLYLRFSEGDLFCRSGSRVGSLDPNLTPEWLENGMVLEVATLTRHQCELFNVEYEEIKWCPKRSVDEPPSSETTAQAIVRSIVENVTREELVQRVSPTYRRAH